MVRAATIAWVVVGLLTAAVFLPDLLQPQQDAGTTVIGLVERLLYPIGPPFLFAVLIGRFRQRWAAIAAATLGLAVAIYVGLYLIVLGLASQNAAAALTAIVFAAILAAPPVLSAFAAREIRLLRERLEREAAVA